MSSSVSRTADAPNSVMSVDRTAGSPSQVSKELNVACCAPSPPGSSIALVVGSIQLMASTMANRRQPGSHVGSSTWVEQSSSEIGVQGT